LSLRLFFAELNTGGRCRFYKILKEIIIVLCSFEKLLLQLVIILENLLRLLFIAQRRIILCPASSMPRRKVFAFFLELYWMESCA
jgi:hypothetical protein